MNPDDKATVKTVTRSTQTVESQSELRREKAATKYQELQAASKTQELQDISRENDHLRRKYETLLAQCAEERAKLLDEIHELHTYIVLGATRETMLSNQFNHPHDTPFDLSQAILTEMTTEMQLMRDRMAPLRRTCAHFMHRYSRELQQSEAIRADYERKMTDAGLAFNTELQFSQSKLAAMHGWLDDNDVKLPTLFENMSVRDADGDGQEISVKLGPKKRKEVT
jgi:hypothetical protein